MAWFDIQLFYNPLYLLSSSLFYMIVIQENGKIDILSIFIYIFPWAHACTGVHLHSISVFLCPTDPLVAYIF